MTDSTAKIQSSRLLSLDILRGITIAGMILVNNPGSWGSIYAPLRHAPWNGLTPTDLVFPFFMFIMGISTYFSLRKYDFKASYSSVWKIVKRTLVILLIGWGIGWFGMFLRGVMNPDVQLADAVFTFDHIRLLGVLPRLALCYGVSAIVALTMKYRHIIWLVGALLVAYTIMLLTGHGYEFSDANIISIVDHKVLGESHMYRDTIDGVSLKFDPEGLLSTIPSIAHCLIGFLCGGLIVSTADNRDRCNKLFIVGAVLTFAGFLLSYGLPINKKIWSPTFVFTTCGLASTLLALLIWIIDIRGHRRWCTFFHSFGINPLFLYCLSAVLAICFGAIRVPLAASETGHVSITTLLYKYTLTPLCGGDTTLASLIYAILFVMLCWSVGYILYKKKIYIKI